MLRYAINPFTQELLTAEQWILEPSLQRSNDRGTEARYIEGKCPICGGIVLVRAVASQKEKIHFYHKDNTNCPLSNKVREPRDINYLYGNEDTYQLKREIKNSMYKIYYKCYQLCNRDLPYSEFIKMCKHFKNMHAINYRGLRLEYVPYVLLNLAGKIRGEFFFALDYDEENGNDLWENTYSNKTLFKINVEKKANYEDFIPIEVNGQFLSENRQPTDYLRNREDEIYSAIGIL